MVLDLWLPILLSAVALFFASFLSWMILQLHKADWGKLSSEDAFMNSVRTLSITPGNYMFPLVEDAKERAKPENQAKFNAGPVGILTVFEGVNMGRNLGLQFLFFLVSTFCLAYLATIGLAPGASTMDVFRFMATGAFVMYLAGIVQHAIWFNCRIVGHVIECIAYGAMVGGIFAAMWPKA